jgi:hypothetical protein
MGSGGRLRCLLAAARQGRRRRHRRGGQLIGARWVGHSGAPNTMRKEAKQRGDHGGAHLGVANGSAGGSCGSWRRGGSSGFK